MKMSDIKLRAFIREYGRIYDVNAIFFNTGFVRLNKQYGETEFMLEEIELMQYTGLQDINNVKIYEEDIVKVNADYSDNCNEYFCVRYSEHEAGYVLHKISDGVILNNIGYFGRDIIFHHRLEVVGNIYENPEILLNCDCTDKDCENCRQYFGDSI